MRNVVFTGFKVDQLQFPVAFASTWEKQMMFCNDTKNKWLKHLKNQRSGAGRWSNGKEQGSMKPVTSFWSNVFWMNKRGALAAGKELAWVLSFKSVVCMLKKCLSVTYLRYIILSFSHIACIAAMLFTFTAVVLWFISTPMTTILVSQALVSTKSKENILIQKSNYFKSLILTLPTWFILK